MTTLSPDDIHALLVLAQGGSIRESSDATRRRLKSLGFTHWNSNLKLWQLTDRGRNTAELHEQPEAPGDHDEIFRQHLDRLHGFYGVDASSLPRADELLSGTARVLCEFDFSQQWVILDSLTAALAASQAQWGSQPNPVTSAQVVRACDFLTSFPEELRVMFWHRVFHELKIQINSRAQDHLAATQWSAIGALAETAEE